MLTKNLIFKLVTFSTMLFCVFSSYAEENNVLDNTIDVGAPGIKKIRIAIPNFILSDKNIPINTQELNSLTNKMVSVLEFTRWFDFIPQDTLLVPKSKVPAPIDFKQWQLVKAEFVIVGKILSANKGKRFNLELRLFNIKAQNQTLGKMYTDLNPSLANIAIRRFADLAIESLTGSQGPFMSQIVFIGKKTIKENPQVYIADFDGNNVKQITNNNSINMSPSWAKDGTKISYTSFMSGRPQIYVYNLITKKTTKITNSKGNSSGSNWSPTEDLIAYSASTGEGQTHIYTINPFGGNKELLINTSEIEVEPAFSPDGKELAYTSGKFGKPMIFIKNLSSGNTTRITYAGWYNASANWSPDGKNLVFASYDRAIDKWDLFKINTNGSNLERLTLNQGDNEKPSWSPDGRFILFQSDRNDKKGTHRGPNKLFVMTKDGSYQRILNIPIYDVKQPSWGPRVSQFEDE